jgi:eukaryotic-like serine/threonine-protein kinase
MSGPPSAEPTLQSLETGRATTGVSGGHTDHELLPGGALVGRYVVRSLLGTGGMGVVYVARDPELDRDVALKLVRAQPSAMGASGASDGRRRVLREAQAMAKLSHRNAVTVHDVGVHQDTVFIAMELLAGRTLARALAPRPPMREILEMFVQAGRGLAAAHAAGIVHRDFKPENVIVCDAPESTTPGRVCVTDFGLARAARDPARDAEPVGTTGPSEIDLTQPGTLAGTPAYMAPEQHLGTPTSPQTDQFAFCVALYEALFGQRPFVGETIPQLAVAVVEGRRRPLPQKHAVPRRVVQAVLRGLELEPADRWPSMQLLLDELARDPSARRRRWLAIGGVTVALGGAVALGSVIGREPSCADAGDAVADLWSEPRSTRVRASFGESGRSGANEVFDRVAPSLDDYVARLRVVAVEACDGHRRGEHSDGLFDAQVRCIEGRKTALDRLLVVLAAADVDVVDRAASAIASLPDPADCTDFDALALDVVPPRESALAIAKVRENIADAAASYSAGRWRESADVARTALDEARGLEWQPLVAEAAFELGRALAAVGDLADAEETLAESFWTASRTRHDRVAAQAAVELVHLVGFRAGRHDDAVQWEQQAETAVARLGDDGAMQATLWLNRAVVEQARGHLDEAYALTERAVRLRVDLRGESDPSVASAMQNLGAIRFKQGRFDDAQAQFEAARATLVVALGEDHPSAAKLATNLGAIELKRGRLEDARANFERAIAVLEQREAPSELYMALNNLSIVQRKTGQLAEAQTSLERAMVAAERAHGREHTGYAAALSNLANVVSARGDHERALELHREALAIRERVLGLDHEEVSYPLGGIGNELVLLGRAQQALPYYERQLAIVEAKLGVDHPRVALARVNLGGVLLDVGMPERATAQLEQAVALRERILPPESPDIATAKTQLARARRFAGQLDEAIAVASVAESSLSAHPGEPGTRAVARVELARALWERGKGDDRTRARALAGQAREELLAVPGASVGVADVDSLLATMNAK